ncbi:hypothetical protein [Streptomyces sp. NBC_01214]|uniref:hypothetical protein n=1 Tax=Streptomyces sp. NBC_01214 TaxID=2903777 RepID=UPI002B1D4D41|nr:hypothetical protein [Streptomyces sp. NBC_01214]
MPLDGEREQLCLGAAEPVLRLARTTNDAADSPVQADVMLRPTGRQQLRYKISLAPSRPG